MDFGFFMIFTCFSKCQTTQKTKKTRIITFAQGFPLFLSLGLHQCTWFLHRNLKRKSLKTHLQKTYISKTIQSFYWLWGVKMLIFCLVLAMVLEIYVFRRCVFNDFLLRCRCKIHVHWWSPRLKNSGNPCAKLIIIVFFVFFIVWHLEKNVKIMKFQSPYGVTHKHISVIFIKNSRSTYGKSGFPESLWSLYSKHFEGFEGRSLAAMREIM